MRRAIVISCIAIFAITTAAQQPPMIRVEPRIVCPPPAKGRRAFRTFVHGPHVMANRNERAA